MRGPARIGWATAVLLAGCGQGSTSFPDGVGGSGGLAFQGNVVLARAAVVASDVDGDGANDLVAFDREGLGAVKCWRNEGGAYGEAPPAWSTSPEVVALRADCDARDDANLLEGLGVHRAETRAYVVLHVGDGVEGVATFPALDTVEPPSGSPGDLVRLRGEGLAAPGAPPSATFGGLAAQVLFAFSDEVFVVVPPGLPLGLVDVVLTTGGLSSIPVPFTVVARPAPVLESISPATVAPGTLALLYGEDLGTPLNEVVVTFAGVAAPRALALGEAVVAEVPADAVSGPVVVTVDGVASNALDVVVGALPAPVVTALVPAAASPGSLVRIEGTDLAVLGESVVVTFDGVRAALFGFGAGSLVAIVPASATDGDVVVTSGGRSSAGTPFDVVDRGAPRIDAADPPSAPAGSLVHLRGVDLVDLSAWRPGSLPPWPPFGDLRVTVGGLVARWVWPTVEGLDVLVPFEASTGDVVVRVNGVDSAPFPLTIP
jgi:hypothetical protein